MPLHDPRPIIQQFLDADDKAVAAIEEALRRYADLVSEVKEAEPLPPDLEIQMYRKLLSIQKRIERMVTKLERARANMVAVCDEIAASQLKRWVDGLDDELRTLQRSPE